MYYDLLDLTQLYVDIDPYIVWDSLLLYYREILNNIAPVKEITKVPETEPWVTCNLLSLIRKRDALKDSCSNKAKVEPAIIAEYNKIQNEVKRTVVGAKRDYTRNLIKNLDPSSKLYWSQLHNISNLSKKKGDKTLAKIYLTNQDGKDVETNDVPDHINEAQICPIRLI